MLLFVLLSTPGGEPAAEWAAEEEEEDEKKLAESNFAPFTIEFVAVAVDVAVDVHVDEIYADAVGRVCIINLLVLVCPWLGNL